MKERQKTRRGKQRGGRWVEPFLCCLMKLEARQAINDSNYLLYTHPGVCLPALSPLFSITNSRLHCREKRSHSCSTGGCVSSNQSSSCDVRCSRSLVNKRTRRHAIKNTSKAETEMSFLILETEVYKTISPQGHFSGSSGSFDEVFS